MSIHNIQNTNLPDNAVNKTGKTESVQKTEKNNPAESSGRIRTDKVQITGAKFADDISFAKDVLSKIDSKQLESLKEIRIKIKKGFYDNQSVQEEVGIRLKNDLIRIEAFIHSQEETTDEPVSLNQEKIDFLKNNSSVTDRISEKILKDLKNI
ncbi:MAG: hypothetical protein ACFCU6_12910 [Balneolaceae bacterium]